jgi:hypothetical protein
MLQRCTNPKHKNWDRYGGRGIKVCDRWQNSFENFLADMGEKPFLKAQLDREDNEGNYEPGNCRWVSSAENVNNRFNTIMLDFDGRRQSLSEWSKEVGIGNKAIAYRLKAGWPVEEALTRPLAHSNGWLRGVR